MLLAGHLKDWVGQRKAFTSRTVSIYMVLVLLLGQGPSGTLRRMLSCCMEVKVFNVSPFRQKGGWPSILTEVAKCDIVCANCHRVRTAQRRKGL